MFELIVAFTADTFGVAEVVAQTGLILGGGGALCAVLAKHLADLI